VQLLDDDALAAYAGNYETIAVFADIEPDQGHLEIRVRIKPETLAQLTEAGQEPPDDQPPFRIGLIEGKPDHYVVTEGPAKGMKGYFTRSASGDVDGVHVGGRLATRLDAETAAADSAVLTAP